MKSPGRMGIAAALLAAACSSTPVNQSANIKGSHDLALVGDLLFVTSSERNELRVLDLSLVSPIWVKAPNPLEALSVPVLDRPVALAHDVHYEDLVLDSGVVPGGKEVGGPYVYAMSGGAAAISIVAADRAHLVEVKRLSTQGSVTAMAARGEANGHSTLYFTTLDAGEARLYRADLPALEGPDGLLAMKMGALNQLPVYLTSLLPGEVGASLVVLPGTRLVLATRQHAGTSGRALLIDSANPLAPRTLNFPQTVRSLYTHPGVPGTGLGAGARVFGILDEEACPTANGCGGLVAVDTTTGEVALDASGAPMMTLAFGAALPRGLAFSSSQPVTAPNSPLALLGAATTSTGEITLFDAFALRHLDANTNGPQLSSFELRSAAGALLTPAPEAGPNTETLALADGATQDQVVTLEFQGYLPGLYGLPTTDGDGLSFPAGPEALARAAVEDSIEAGATGGDCASVPLTVSAVSATGLVVAGPLPAECAGRTRFSVRAAGAKPYVVTGTIEGYLGRTGPNDSFSFKGSYYFRPDGFDGAVPEIAFYFRAADPQVARGDRYLLQTSGNFTPLTTSIGTSNSQPCTSLLPGAIVHAEPTVRVSGEDKVRPRAYIAYPSDNAVLDLDLATVTRAPATNAFCYR